MLFRNLVPSIPNYTVTWQANQLPCNVRMKFDTWTIKLGGEFFVLLFFFWAFFATQFGLFSLSFFNFQTWFVTFLQCNATLYSSMGDANFFKLKFFAKVTIICFALMVIRHYFWNVICLQYFCIIFLQCNAILYHSIGDADFLKLKFNAKVTVICFALMVIRHYFWKVICLQYFYNKLYVISYYWF